MNLEQRQDQQLYGEAQKNIKEIETPHARYKMIYNNHFAEPVSPETIQDVDAVVLEAVTTPYSAPTDFRYDLLSQKKIYSKIISSAAEQEKPLFIADLVVDKIEDADRLLQDDIRKYQILSVAEFLACAGLGIWAYSDVLYKPMTRRQLLKTGAKLAGAFYFAPAVLGYMEFVVRHEQEPRHPDETSFQRKAERLLGKMNRRIHPELRSVSAEGRDNLIAEKSEQVALILEKELSKKPALGIVIGGEHYGIEDALKSTREKRIENIHGDFKGALSLQAAVARVDFSHDEQRNTKVKITILRSNLE